MVQLSKYLKFVSELIINMWDNHSEENFDTVAELASYSTNIESLLQIISLIQLLLLASPSSLHILLKELQCEVI